MPAYSDNEGPVPKQLTPTASWWFEIGGDAFIKVISLRDTLPGSGHGSPPPGWTARYDFYFLKNELGDLESHVGTSEIDAVVKGKNSVNDPDEITSNHMDVIDEVTDTNAFTYLMRGKSILTTNDWTAGTPPVTDSSNVLLYYQLKGTVTSPSPRVIFELSSDKESIVRITWLTQQTHTGYAAGFLLEPWTPPSSWTGWYHYSFTP